MNLTVDEAMEIAQQAKNDGLLNRHPKACIALAEEVRQLRRVLQEMASNQREKAMR